MRKIASFNFAPEAEVDHESLSSKWWVGLRVDSAVYPGYTIPHTMIV